MKNLLIFTPISIGIVAKETDMPAVYGGYVKVVNKGEAILLSCIQILEIAIPILFVITKIIINKRRQNNKNTVKNICLYIFIAVIIGLVFLGIGFLILNSKNIYGYSSKTIDYIYYNGEIVYYHR